LSGAAEAISKGTVAMSVFMAVIQSMETAITNCEKMCTANCTDDPVHSIDEAVAYYAGSLEGETGGSSSGKFLYDLANQRALQMKTAGDYGNDSVGTAYVNGKIVQEFERMQQFILQKQCYEASLSKKLIVNAMKVPLIQGVLKLAYTLAYENPVAIADSETVAAEGAAMIAAILPYFHVCDASGSRDVYEMMKVGSNTSAINFDFIKQTLEKSYDCLGVYCNDIGGVYTVNGYAAGAEPCGGGSVGHAAPVEHHMSGGAIFGIVVAALLGATFLAALVYRRKKRQIRSLQRRSAANIAAVAEIS
jgi:hypothetical protein